MNAYAYQIIPVGEQSVDIVFPNQIDVAENLVIQAVAQQLMQSQTPGVVAVIPAYRTLTVNYDVRQISYAQLSQNLQTIINQLNQPGRKLNARLIEIPVCYDESFGPDLQDVADFGHMSVADLIQMHTETKYFIYMMGFLPGFAYMGSVPEQIAMPRLDHPRAALAPGSVGIAGAQTGMYPVTSPGGWRLLGRTPLQLFNPLDPKLRYHAGDYIQFTSISRADYDEIQALDAHGEYTLNISQVEGA